MFVCYLLRYLRKQTEHYSGAGTIRLLHQLVPCKLFFIPAIFTFACWSLGNVAQVHV